MRNETVLADIEIVLFAPLYASSQRLLNFAVPCNLYPCWGRKSSQTRTTGRKRSGISRPIRAVRGSKPGVQTRANLTFAEQKRFDVSGRWIRATGLRSASVMVTGVIQGGPRADSDTLQHLCPSIAIWKIITSIRTIAGLACVIYRRREPKRKSDKTLQTFRVRIPRSEGSLRVV